MNIVYFSAHSILEYDEVRLFTELGHDVFSIGAYEDPSHPGDDNGDLKRPPKRPAIPGAKAHPELSALCHEVRHHHGPQDLDWVIDWAKADLHPDIIEWADVIVCPFFPDQWIGMQWDRIKHKRVIWRTCGQSNPQIEQRMARFHAQGLEIVRYSPAERRYFESIGAFAGQDALIRFAKDPADWYGWTGEDAVIGNVTQNMAERGNACGLDFWLAATEGLPTRPAGPNSELLPGGIGALSYDEMREYLRRCRAYLYTGTVPASYTLGLIEAMMTGTPVVSIGPMAMGIGPLFEGHELTHWTEANGYSPDDPREARGALDMLLRDELMAQELSEMTRRDAIHWFGVETIAPQWEQYLAGVVVAA